jgi:hypothetical protein
MSELNNRPLAGRILTAIALRALWLVAGFDNVAALAARPGHFDQGHTSIPHTLARFVWTILPYKYQNVTLPTGLENELTWVSMFGLDQFNGQALREDRRIASLALLSLSSLFSLRPFSYHRLWLYKEYNRER